MSENETAGTEEQVRVEPISDEELRELLEAATPGPWEPKNGTIWATVKNRNGSYITGYSTSEADATLLALAPSLAADLLRAREVVEAAREMRDKSRSGLHVDAYDWANLTKLLAAYDRAEPQRTQEEK